MTSPPAFVVDSSAIMAFMLDEPGAAAVASSLRRGAAMSAVNLGEVLSVFSDRGSDPDAVMDELAAGGVFPGYLSVVPLDTAGARASALLRAPTRHAGLSLGDRACLALGRSLGVPVLTADRTWVGLRAGVKVVCIR